MKYRIPSHKSPIIKRLMEIRRENLRQQNVEDDMSQAEIQHLIRVAFGERIVK